MTEQKPKTRTITLTNRLPVRIREDAWPLIAHGSYLDLDSQYLSRVNRRWRADVRVRQHADGRAIVYGVYDYSTAFPNERDFRAKAGVLLGKDDDLVRAIHAVGATLVSAVRRAGLGYSAHIAVAAARDCVADLPPVELE